MMDERSLCVRLVRWVPGVVSGVLFGFPRRWAFRVPGRVSLRVASVGRPRVPLPFILMANFLVAVGFCPRPPGAARFARGVGDFVAVMLRMFFLAVFLAPFRGHLFGGWLGGMFWVGILSLGGRECLAHCLPAHEVSLVAAWAGEVWLAFRPGVVRGQVSWPGVPDGGSVGRTRGLASRGAMGWSWPVRSCERGGFVPLAF